MWGGSRWVQAGIVIMASGVLAGCNLFTGPLSLEAGSRAEETFTSGSLQPVADFSTPTRSAGPPVDYDGVSFRAAVVPVDTALDTGPMGLRIQVRALNESSQTVTLPVGGCTVWPEFHDPADLAGEAAWVPEGQCMQAPYDVVLEPGEEEVFEFLAYDAMLAHGLEDGRYRVVARFRHADETLRLDAGTTDVRLRLPNMAYHVRVDEQSGGGLSAKVRVENRNPGAVHLEYGACAIGFELHDESDLTGNAIPLSDYQVCPAYLAIARLGPGETLEAGEFERRISGSATRGVPSGEYHLAVTLELNWRTYRFPMGTVRVR